MLDKGKVWFAPMAAIAAQVKAGIENGADTPRIDRLPYYAERVSGRRTARRYLRVDTLSTIRLSAHSRNRSPSRSTCQLSKLTSLPARSRTRGRANYTLPPW